MDRRRRAGQIFFDISKYYATAFLAAVYLKPELATPLGVFGALATIVASFLVGWFVTPKE